MQQAMFLLRDEVIRYAAVFSLLAGAGIIVLGVATGIVFEQDTILVVHFQNRQVDFWGTRRDAFAIAGIGMALLAMNWYIVRYLFNRERILSRIVAVATSGIAILIFIALAVIMSVSQ